MKRILSIALALIMVLSACSFAVAEEKAPFTCWLVGTDAQDASVFAALQMVCEATGIYPEFTLISPAAKAERLNLMWASPEDMPDLVLGGGIGSKAELETYASYGQVRDLKPIMQTMPNMQKYMNEGGWDYITSGDGGIYYFPTMVNNNIDTGIYINNVWLQNLGLKKPETIEELYDVLVAFRDKDPNGNGKQDEIPLAIEPDALHRLGDSIFSAFGRPVGWVVEEGQVVYNGVQEETKEAIKFARKLYAEGLMDTELFTQDLTGFRAKAQAEERLYGVIVCFIAVASNRCNTKEVTDSEMYHWQLPLKAADGVRHYRGPILTTGNVNGFVTSNCSDEELEAVAKWIDYMLEPAMSLQLDQAPLGIGYYIGDDGMWYSKTDAPEGYESVGAWRMANHFQQVPRMLTSDSKKVAGLEVYTDRTSNGGDYAGRNEYYLSNGVQLVENLPTVAATPEENEILLLYNADIDKMYKETVANWISGNGDVDAEWDAFVANMNALGLEEVQQVYQDQYDRANGL